MRAVIILCLVAIACAHTLSVQELQRKFDRIIARYSGEFNGEELFHINQGAKVAAKNVAHKATETTKTAAAKIKGLFAANMMNINVQQVEAAAKTAAALATKAIGVVNTDSSKVQNILTQIQAAENNIQNLINLAQGDGQQIKTLINEAKAAEQQIENFYAQNSETAFGQQVIRRANQFKAFLASATRKAAEAAKAAATKTVAGAKKVENKVEALIAQNGETTFVQEAKKKVEVAAHKTTEAAKTAAAKIRGLFAAHQLNAHKKAESSVAESTYAEQAEGVVAGAASSVAGAIESVASRFRRFVSLN